MKKIKSLTILLMTLVISVSLSSCSDLFGTKVSGYYASETNTTTFNKKTYLVRSVYNFVSDTEVVYYSMVANGQLWNTSYTGNLSVSFPDHSGWYCQRNAGKKYSYVEADGKIFIADKGVIFSIEDGGDALYHDGDGDTGGYFKW